MDGDGRKQKQRQTQKHRNTNQVAVVAIAAAVSNDAAAAAHGSSVLMSPLYGLAVFLHAMSRSSSGTPNDPLSLSHQCGIRQGH